MTTAQLDAVDRQLIDILARDARVSNRKIATDLGVTEGTVRGRIKRLQQERLIAFTAITSFGMEDPTKLAFIGIQADIQNVQAIARQIADLATVNAVIITMPSSSPWAASPSLRSCCLASLTSCTKSHRTRFWRSRASITSKPRSL